ncbi:MAG: prephenate dehydratase [Myxococcota bacterium]
MSRRDPVSAESTAPTASDAPAASALADLRARIDAVDDAILALLNDRATLVGRVGEFKQNHNTGVYEPSRERRIVEALESRNPGPFPSDGIGPVFREIISGTRSLETRVGVAFLGPEGTFSHLAAREQFGAMVDYHPVPTIGDVFRAVESGRVDHGMAPVENSTEGVVTQTLDALTEHEVPVCAERVVRVSLTLVSKSGRLEDVRRVVSHPQPLAQSRRWLEEALPDAERVEAASTAAAARLAAEDGSVAAIGTALAAETYGLEVISRGIEDRHDNTTRFLVIGGDPPAASGHDLTSAVFTIRRDEAGGLLRLIEPMAQEGVSLTSIQLRPIKGRPWEYYFFIDWAGHQSDPAVQRALDVASQVAHTSRVLGSFPRARTPLAGSVA